jgi:hypothetical protein
MYRPDVVRMRMPFFICIIAATVIMSSTPRTRGWICAHRFYFLNINWKCTVAYRRRDLCLWLPSDRAGVLLSYFLIRTSTAKCYAKSSKRFRCELMLENGYTFWPWVPRVRTASLCATCLSNGEATRCREGGLESLLHRDGPSGFIFVAWCV